MRLDRVAPQQAHESLSRFINSHFRNQRAEHERARITIPADLRRDDDLLLSRFIDEAAELLVPRPLVEWHEDFGAVLWWYLDDGHTVSEPPYAGTPLDDDWPWADDQDEDGGWKPSRWPEWSVLVWTPLPQIARFEPAPAPAGPLCAACGQTETVRGGDVHCQGDCDDASHGEPSGCHHFVAPAPESKEE